MSPNTTHVNKASKPASKEVEKASEEVKKEEEASKDISLKEEAETNSKAVMVRFTNITTDIITQIAKSLKVEINSKMSSDRKSKEELQYELDLKKFQDIQAQIEADKELGCLDSWFKPYEKARTIKPNSIYEDRYQFVIGNLKTPIKPEKASISARQMRQLIIDMMVRKGDPLYELLYSKISESIDE